MARCGELSAELEIRPYLRCIPLNVVYQAMFGQKMDPENPGSNPELHILDSAYKAAFSVLGAGAIEDFIPPLHVRCSLLSAALSRGILPGRDTAVSSASRAPPHRQVLPTPHNRLLWRCRKVRDDVMAKWILERRKASKDGRPSGGDMLDYLLSLQAENELSDIQVVQLIHDTVSAATDTTAVSAEWLVLLLAANPEAQDAVQQELDEAFGSRIPEAIDRQGLPVLTATVMEVLRLRSPAPLLLPHRATEDLTIGGYGIPANTLIFVNYHSMCTDPKYWKDPQVFRPQRFLEEEKHLELIAGANRSTMDGHKYIPFGIGPRHCPGYEMALQELFLIAAHLLHSFRWAPAAGKEVNLEGKYGLTLEPAQEQRLQVTLRRKQR